jgi:hypothetical protein
MKCFASTKISLALAGIIAMIMSMTAFGATIYYVDGNATGMGIGENWDNAFRFLQDALQFSYVTPRPVEIRVARGVYMPDQGMFNTPGNRAEAFVLIDGVTVKGGYAGRSYSNPGARDVERYKTVLSGDLLGNDRQVDYAWDLVGADDRYDNSYSVVIAWEVGETAVLDGFIIQGGYGNELYNNYGAGMYNHYASPTIIDCIFEENFAGDNALSMGDGAGMSNYYSNPKLDRCTFRKNCVGYEGNPNIFFPGVMGGAVSNMYSSPVFTDCIFDRNVSFDVSGAIDVYDSNAVMENCTFNANVVFGWGGAIMCYNSNIDMAGCMFALNAAGRGGGVHSDSSVVTMTNCTFADNFAMYEGNGFWCDSSFLDPPSSLDFTNCILWDGEEQVLNNDGSDITISYSDVQGCWSGDGGNNIDTDPLFAAPGYWVHIDDPNIVPEPEDPNAVQFDGDYHLKSGTGRWDPIEGDWIRDDVNSLCIDAGDPGSPVGDEPEPNGGIINMGAYGGTEQASMSPEH